MRGASLIAALPLLILALLPASRLCAETCETGRSYDWYKTQFGTGGTGNCGPACVAMAIFWATGADVSVRKVREEIGEPGGNRATSLAHQKMVLDARGVRAEYTFVASVEDLRAVVDRGRIAILWIHTGRLGKPSGDVTQTNRGRYYDDECGHYIVLKGYTEDGDGDWFIVHDPIPGDWTTNTVRYPDGSMLGRSRWFKANEVWSSLMERKVIEIHGTSR